MNSVKKLSDENKSNVAKWVWKNEWWVMKIEWPFFVGQTGSYCCNNGVDYLCPHWIPWWSHCLCLFQFSFSLCLVRVKAFLENISFSGNAIFRKGKCFSCVWLYFKKFSKKYFLVFGKCYKEKTNPENTDKTQIDARRSTGFDGAVLRELQSDDRVVDWDLAKHRFASRDRDRRFARMWSARRQDPHGVQ